ncbi:hypothetical protein ACWC9H_26030 [Streptomyces sp. NPDC001251]|uniref:hypothetical protein n=1 Tax=Streptomyces TaxID=1883 RepID=UPI000C27A0A1|nr:hypothetical protein [Streptomyces sp. CB01201]PJM98300.1 hypothetical protein CG740_36425 [Streptomyces sp. CB01201]
MAYQLSFFCRSGEESGDEALDHLLDHLLESGNALLGEWLGPYEDSVAAFRLGTRSKDSDGPVADLLTLELHVGVAEIAESVIAASPHDERGIWGCDLLATVTLGGDNPDWALVHHIWAAVVSLWKAVPWDESSGFGVAAGELPQQGFPGDGLLSRSASANQQGR